MLVKSFRLFVSSTFADFVQEREVLQDKVFPALDTYCAAKGYQFHPLDLRWGVNEEAQLDQRTTEICLGEVDAAKGYPPPNFLIMIGDRYGWVPLPFAIARDEFEAATTWLEGRGEHDIVRELRHVYQLDENHVIRCGLVAADRASAAPNTIAYTLRSREEEIAELKDAELWHLLEARLRVALQNAADHLLKRGRIDPAGHQKYFLSLTEQEIIQGLPGYRHDVAREDAASEKRADADGPHAIAWIREMTATPADRRTGLLRRWLGRSPQPESRADDNSQAGLAAMKAGIRHTLTEDSVFTARATTDPEGKLDEAYLTTFVSTIQRKIMAVIDRQITAVEEQERASDFELQSERAEHRAFAEERRKIFIGRDSNRAAIASYVEGCSARPLVLYGLSGSGKSALMACAVADAEGASRAPVIYRFIGATAASSDQRAMLVSLTDDLAAHGIVQKPEQWEDDANKFVGQVRELLSAIDMPVVIFLDALDQLRKPYRPAWLPNTLPSAVKIIVSVLDDEAFPADIGVYKGLRQLLPVDAFLEIDPLDPTHGHDILTALEQAARRRLQPSQRDYIVAQFVKAGASPLYIRIAFEIARTWRSTEKVGTDGRELAEDCTALIAQLIDELSTVRHHERVLVSRTLGYIAAAKDGLSASELTAVLARDADVMRAISSEQHGIRTSKVPASVWARLHRQLAPFLADKRVDDQHLMQFFHRQLTEVAGLQYYEANKVALHSALASYFDSRTSTPNAQAVGAGMATPRYDKRSLSELPYQLHGAGKVQELDRVLESPDWIDQKFSAFGSAGLISDYEQFGRRELHRAIGRTLQLASGICAQDRRQLLPQLHGRLMSYEGSAHFCATARALVQRPAFVTTRASLTSPNAEIARLEGYPGRVYALAALPDGRLVSSGAQIIIFWDTNSFAELSRLDAGDFRHEIHALAVLPDGRLASASSGDNTVRLWDTNTGNEVARLVGHRKEVSALAALPDGRLASGSDDMTIRVWDTKTGAELVRCEGHQGAVHALAALPDGHFASGSGFGDQTIRVWDTNTGVELAKLGDHPGFDRRGLAWVRALAVLPDGRLASGGDDPKIRLWDPKTGLELLHFGHDPDVYEGVNALAVLPDGRLASGSGDKIIRLWDTNSGAELARFEGHFFGVNVLSVLPQGRLASASNQGLDNTIRIWDTQNTAGLAKREVHAERVSALTVMSGGRLASSSWDKTVMIWDIKTGSRLARLEGHGSFVNTLAALPDGRLATASGDLIRIWDVNSGAQLSRLYGCVSGHEIYALAVLRDGRLASGSSDHTIRLWDTRTGAQVAILEGHERAVDLLAVLPDDRLASCNFTGLGDGTVRLWNTKTGAQLGRFKEQAFSLAVLQDGGLVLGCDKVIRLRDAGTGNELATLEGHNDRVRALAVLPDGRLASGSEDKTVRLWDANARSEIARLDLDVGVTSIAALPQGGLVAGDDLGRMHWLEILDATPAP
jgi:WD40 repeat protein